MPEQSRQLAAIMFTDIVGYTALMGEDEEKAFQLLEKNRNIQKSIIESFGGRFLKEIGDGILASFKSASDAVYCAGAIQNAAQPESDLSLRIGIHIGDVVFKGDDVFGDGVNIASRIQGIAPIDGILISESVHKNVSNKKGIETKFVKEEILKNVKEPVRIYEVKVEGIETPAGAPAQPTDAKPKAGNRKGVIIGAVVIILLVLGYVTYQYQSKESATPVTPVAEPKIEKSIAVLPFRNDSQEEGTEYFANGVMEAILNHLSKIQNLKVISRTSVEQYRGTSKTATQIADELGVVYLLEGSAQQADNSVRINVQLINARQDQYIWSENYDRELTDIFSTQSEIAQRIAGELKANLSSEEKLIIEKIPTVSTEANDFYLKGLYQLYQMRVEGFIQALKFFQKAVELDSNFALAYSGIAYTYLSRSSVYGDLPPDVASKNAILYINKALDIDQDLIEAHRLLGWTKFYFQWDFKGAEEAYLEAIKLDPNNANNLYAYCDFLNNLERHEEALLWNKKLRELDPLAASVGRVQALFYLGKTDEAIKIQKSLSEVFQHHVIFTNLGFLLLNVGEYEEAIDAQKKALELAGRRLPRMLAWLAAAYAKNGQEDKANELLEELKELKNKSLAGSPSFFIAVIYSALEEKELAFQWFEKAYEDHDVEMVWLKTEPQLYPLHDDPRFQDLLKRVGFDVSG